MKTTKEMIEVMTAYDNGAEIEYTGKGEEDYWHIDENPNWDWSVFDYRIKEQKKTVTIEKWLVTNNIRYDVAETSNIKDYLDNVIGWNKVKLLDIYEVEI